MCLNGRVEEWVQNFIQRTSKTRPMGGGGSESKPEGNTKIGTSVNPQRTTQRRIPEDLNP